MENKELRTLKIFQEIEKDPTLSQRKKSKETDIDLIGINTQRKKAEFIRIPIYPARQLNRPGFDQFLITALHGTAGIRKTLGKLGVSDSKIKAV